MVGTRQLTIYFPGPQFHFSWSHSHQPVRLTYHVWSLIQAVTIRSIHLSNARSFVFAPTVRSDSILLMAWVVSRSSSFLGISASSSASDSDDSCCIGSFIISNSASTSLSRSLTFTSLEGGTLKVVALSTPRSPVSRDAAVSKSESLSTAMFNSSIDSLSSSAISTSLVISSSSPLCSKPLSDPKVLSLTALTSRSDSKLSELEESPRSLSSGRGSILLLSPLTFGVLVASGCTTTAGCT